MVAEMVGNLARRAAPSAVMSVVFITTAAWAWRANTGAAGGGDEAVRELGEGQPLGASDLQELTAQRRVVDGEVDDGGDIASGDEANGVAAGAGGGVQHRHQHHVLGAGGGGRLDQGPVAVAVDGLGAGPAGSGEPVHGRDHRRTATDRRGDRGRVAHVAGEGLDRAEQLRRAGRVAGEHPDRPAAAGEQPDDLGSEGAGAAGDQDHAVTPSWVPAPTARAVWASTSPLPCSTGSR